MAVWLMLLVPVAPLLVVGLLTEEALLLVVSGAKAVYNLGAYGVSRWLRGNGDAEAGPPPRVLQEPKRATRAFARATKPAWW